MTETLTERAWEGYGAQVHRTDARIRPSWEQTKEAADRMLAASEVAGFRMSPAGPFLIPIEQVSESD